MTWILWLLAAACVIYLSLIHIFTDGCNQFCSYCIIPYTRGRVRSRKLEDVRAEVERLVEAGYKEIVLTGIHLSSYGVDFEEGGKKTLLDLIVCLHEVEGCLLYTSFRDRAVCRWEPMERPCCS